MFKMLRKMIQSKKYSEEYVEERIDVFYMVNKLTKEEYLELKGLLKQF